MATEQGSSMRGDPLRVLADRQEICDVLARYCRGIDRLDPNMVRSCYHHDAIDEHGPYKGDAAGFVAYAIGYLRDRFRDYGETTSHMLGQVLVDVAGDTAVAESYFSAAHVRDRDEQLRVFEFHGRYVDRFERRDGVWKISHRIVVHDWSELRDGRRALREGHEYSQGDHHPDDPVFAAGIRRAHEQETTT
jgi:hypothetical protein